MHYTEENSMQQTTQQATISPEDETLKAVEIIENQEHDAKNLVKILQEIQKELGYVPENAQRLVAEKTRVPVSKIYGILSFYNFFRLYPPGRHRINICLGTACYVKGSKIILNKIEEAYNILPGQTTKDRKFSLDTVRCLGCCALAPVMAVDGNVYARNNPTKVLEILKKFT
jgi:NADH:ubiquinone oxidoreductase subunit E